MDLHFVLLSLHLYFVGFFKDVESVAVGRSAFVHQLSKALDFGLVSGLLHIQNIVNLAFNPGAHVGGYFSLFSQLFQTCLNLSGLFFSLSPPLLHFRYFFVIVESRNA